MVRVVITVQARYPTAMCSADSTVAAADAREPGPASQHCSELPLRQTQIGFFALILVEVITGQGFLQTLGITVGRGIGFEI